jgi:hypothetical protein
VNYRQDPSQLIPIRAKDGNAYSVALLNPAENFGPEVVKFAFHAGFVAKGSILGQYAVWDGEPLVFQTPFVASDFKQPLVAKAREIFLEVGGELIAVGSARLLPYGTSGAVFEDFPLLCEGAYAAVCRVDVVLRDAGTDLNEIDIEKAEEWADRYAVEIVFSRNINGAFVEIGRALAGKK